MKQSLLNETIKSENKIVKLDYNLYTRAVKAICNDIKKIMIYKMRK